MAGKRNSGNMDHVMYNKVSRMEAAPQPSIPCSGKTISSDLPICKNFLSYSLSGTEEQHSSNPWSSATSYLQYAGKALNQHLQSNVVSNCQRAEAERSFNSLQPPDKSNSHFSVHQHHRVQNDHMSPSRACPPIAVPRPVYRRPSSFIDPVYGTRDFQSVSGHVESHPLCSPALEWSPTRFAYSPSFYVPGFKDPHPTNNGYFEVTGNPSSLPRDFQELSPVHRQRMDINVPMKSSSSCSQGDVLTDRLHSFAQHNLHELYAVGTAPSAKQRNSAFTSFKHQQYKSSSQNNPECQIYSKSYYSSGMDSYHQRPSPFSCSMDKSLPTHGTTGAISYQGKVHKGYMDTEPRISHIDGMVQTSQFQAQQETQVKSATHTNREIQKEKDVRLTSIQVNKDLCVTSSKVDKEHLFGSAQASSSLHNRNLYGYCAAEPGPHVSFPQQNCSKILPAVLANSMVSSGKESSPISINDSCHTLDKIRVLDVTSVEPTVQHHKTPNTEHINSIMLDSSATPESVNQCKISDNNEISRHGAAAVQSQSGDLPQATPRNVDCPKSPPMPVINDVFSLAPYRAYLEGKAPHPFPIYQKSEVEKPLSTPLLQQQSLSVGNVAKESEKENFKSGNNAEGANVVCPKRIQTVHEQTKESQGASCNNMSEVLDLSFKKSSRTKSSLQDHGQLSEKCHKQSPKKVAERILPNASEEMPNKCQKRCSSEVTSSLSHLKNKISTLHTIVNTSYLEKSPSAGSISSLTQEGFSSTKNDVYQSQDNCPIQEPETLPHLLQKSYSCPTTPQKKTFANNRLHSNQDLPLSLHESNMYKANSKCSIMQSQNKSQYQDTEHKSKQLHEDSKCQATKYLPIQAQGMQPHEHQRRSTPLAIQTLQQSLQLTSPSRTENVPGHGYYACISQPTEGYSFHSSASCSTQSTNISLFVNTIQTPTSLLPQSIIYQTPTVFCPKNFNLPSHPNESIESIERRSRNYVESCQSETSLSGTENDGAGFHSSKAFMFHKYKMMKFSSPGEEIQEAGSHLSSHNLPRSFPSDAAQSLPPSAPESSPTLGEANVSLASVGELAPSGSRKQFSELHWSVRAAITSSVSKSPSNVLEGWLQKTKEEERSKIPAKNKNGSRPSEPPLDPRRHEIWLEFEGVSLSLHKLLSQLETFMFTRKCPFPHVIRAGAIFIPIYLVKEVLFPELLGTSVDRILQKHKVELRPTTLSEEKLLRESKLKDCSSRMLKLLALKQLPDMYPDLLHIFCGHTIQDQLDSRSNKCLGKASPDLSEEFAIASPTKAKSSLILRLKRVCKSSGSIHVYKALQFRPLEKRGTENILKRKVCRRKSYRAQTLISYKRKRRVQSKNRKTKSFPDLVGKRILHLFDDGEQEVWFPGKVQCVHRPSRNPRDTQYEVWYDSEPGTRYFLELLQDYEKGWLQVYS